MIEKWHEIADVVVAGAGGAGLAAAIESAEAGADVIVFEKQPSIADASTSLCAGIYTFAGTDFQGKHGIRDSDDLFRRDILAVGQQKNDPRIVDAYIANQLDAYRWMTRLGVKWLGVDALAGMSLARGHVSDAADTHAVLKKAAESKGARLVFNSPVTGLITDKDGGVTGVTVESGGKAMQIQARKGVVLATGGFSRDTKRLEAIKAGYSSVIPLAGLGHTGDGHRMAEELGAYFKDVEYVKPTFGIHASGKSSAELAILFYSGAVIVNRRGERFVNESLSYKDVGKAALEQPEGIGFQLFDRKIYEVALEKAKGIKPEKAVNGLDETRISLLVEADTVEKLASKLKLPSDRLKATIDKYNADVDAGKDTGFGRATLSGGVGETVKIDTPPFYAYESRGALIGTYGGIAVDEKMHVLTRNGRISGLYAAGELVGGFHGASYMSGTAVGKAVIFGRIAGRNGGRGA
ncbi:MAG: FAD-dependent oxidoreductase [Chloroflexi bacterium]|nr:FAD-dependent oxidoreductase [Chloroflexota bacterium]